MKPDKYQAAFIAEVANEGYQPGNLLADAKAGCGKSTTVEESLATIPKQASIVFAFNKVVADQMSERIEKRGLIRAKASTFNSIGHRAVCRAIRGKVTLDKFKSGTIMRDLGIRFKERFDAQTVERLVSIAKANGYTSAVPWSALAQHMGFAIVNEDIEQQIYAAAEAVLIRSREVAVQDGVIDFDDQLYLPVVEKMNMDKYPYVFVDEAQDVSPIQLEMIAKIATARVICVGDVRQAIYGFRGADSNAISNLTERFKLQALPLNICYRCDRDIIEHVQRLVPDIEARPGADNGSVTDAPYGFKIKSFLSTDMILCRNNAPLFRLAAEFINQRVAFQIKGEGVGAILMSYVGRVLTASGLDPRQDVPLATWKTISQEWFKSEIERYETKGAFGMCDTLEDYWSILRALEHVDGVKSLQDIENALDSILRGNSGPTLSSVHRAKGTEAPRVFIFEPALMPSPRAKEQWQKQQELNLMYVAETRAMHELVYLPMAAVEGGLDDANG